MNLPQWWLDMSEKEQAAYLEQHPASRLAQEGGNREPAQPQQPRPAGRQAGDDTAEGPAGPANTTLPEGGQKFRRVVPKAFANRNFHRVMQTDAGAAGRAVLAEDEQASALVAGAATGAETVGLAPRDREKVKGVLHTAMLGMALGLVVLGALMKEQTEPLSDFCDDAADWLVERAGKGPVLDRDGNLVLDAEDTGDDGNGRGSRFSDDDLERARQHAGRVRGTVVANPQHEVTVREGEEENDAEGQPLGSADDPTQGRLDDGSVREAELLTASERALSALASAGEEYDAATANAKWLFTYTVAYMRATASAASKGSPR